MSSFLVRITRQTRSKKTGSEYGRIEHCATPHRCLSPLVLDQGDIIMPESAGAPDVFTVSRERGFLPARDPLCRLPPSPPIFEVLEQLVSDVPGLLVAGGRSNSPKESGSR